MGQWLSSACILAKPVHLGDLRCLFDMALDEVNCVSGTKSRVCNMVPQSPYPAIRKTSYLFFQVEVKPGQSELAENGASRAPRQAAWLTHVCL